MWWNCWYPSYKNAVYIGWTIRLSEARLEKTYRVSLETRFWTLPIQEQSTGNLKMEGTLRMRRSLRGTVLLLGRRSIESASRWMVLQIRIADRNEPAHYYR